MKILHWLLVLLLNSTIVFADNSFYCPQNHAYISLGMNKNQVLSACGNPSEIKKSANSVVQQIPVIQVIYTTINKGAVFFYPGLDPVYNMFSIPSGSVGTSIEVSLIDDQITSIKLNSSSTNALSICKGGQVQIGDSLSELYNACGTPSNINNSYINRPIPKSENPEVWTYIVGQYQPNFTLTFINGVLKSIQTQ